MTIVQLLPRYIVWHYSQGIVDALHIWKTYLWFFNHLFSIPQLLGTLFSPWRRLGETYRKGTPLELFFEAVVVNILMRLTGAVVRLVFICLGIIILTATVLLGALFVVVWLLLPVSVVFLLLGGIGSIVYGI